MMLYIEPALTVTNTMAGAILKGVATATNTIAATRQLGQSATAGQHPSQVQKTKSSFTSGLGLFYGFVPVNPVVWGLQMPLFIILILIFAFVFDFSWKGAALSAYIIQALIVAYVYSTALSVLSSVFFGV